MCMFYYELEIDMCRTSFVYLCVLMGISAPMYLEINPSKSFFTRSMFATEDKYNSESRYLHNKTVLSRYLHVFVPQKDVVADNNNKSMSIKLFTD